MPLIRDHAFVEGCCVWCPATETAINSARADGKSVSACAERWADDPTKPRAERAADDFDAIHERLVAIRAENEKALAGSPSS